MSRIVGYYRRDGKIHPVTAKSGGASFSRPRKARPLTYAKRQRLPDSDFADERNRKYPIENASHARNALARVARFGTPEQKKLVCEKVHERYPSIHEAHCKLH
ncbi:MAG: DUF6582 domain-containing protein [Nitrososphaerales archaeon]